MPFTDETKFYLPPSFKEFMKDQCNWLRPEAYIREVVGEEQLKALKAERKRLMLKKKNIRKQNLMNLGAPLSGDMAPEELALLEGKI